jgi:hypothetical protein
MTDTMNIIQRGKDGAGHQLLGLLSCLALHGIHKYYFDGHYFMNKEFQFEHIKGEVSSMTLDYFRAIAKCFIEEYSLEIKEYKSELYCHEITKIPKNYRSDTIYSIDNCYHFGRIPINTNELGNYKENIEIVKKFFINEKLPKKRLSEKNIMIHLRQGDAMYGRKKVINKTNNQMSVFIVPKLLKEYPDYTFYIHTDGNAAFLTEILEKNNAKYKVFGKSENIMNVLSDFIYSDIFIAGFSCLSILCTFLGEHKLTIVPDDIKHSIPESAIRIRDYI